jgi:two-component system phosphate regulon sensor histidine kinase PhoR
VMERHSQRLGALLEDLLNLAKLESANPNLEFSNVRLDELCLNAARDWEKKFADKNLHLIVDLAAGSPSVRADASRLQEILYNLLDNAVKYSPQEGEIRLRVERRDKEIALSVSDNGPGISKKDLPRIFERFYRADQSRSGEEGGTGLGLAIVKHIAQLHGGRVEAESDPGEGTTVRVIIPAVTQT